MRLGPILERELARLARRRRTYGSRVVVPLLMIAVIWITDLFWRYVSDGPNTVQEVAWFGRLVFGQFAIIQCLATLWLIPELVGRSIAGEKDSKTLTFLLTTRLSSGSIIVGKVAAGLVQYLACLLAGLPVVLLLPLFGGVEPEFVLLAYAGLGSTALFLAGLSVSVSVVARRVREAHQLTITLIFAWLFGPLVLALTISPLLPTIYGWIRPINEWLLASSPFGLFLNAMGVLPRGTFPSRLGTMIGLQLAVGACLILGAIAGLRPVWRRHEEAGPNRPHRGRRACKRPACGDRPVLWKEIHVRGSRGVVVFVSHLSYLSLVAFLGVVAYYVGIIDVIKETVTSGYGAINPGSRHRPFNQFLRVATIFLSFVYALTVAGFASEGIAVERLRETWLGLIATPLDGREIVRAKMFGAYWRGRGFGGLLVALWSIGLILGSVHPLGFMAALTVLGVSTWLFTALGTYCSLRARNTGTASNTALAPVLVLCMSGFLPNALPESIQSVLFGAGSFPLVEAVMLVSYDDVREGLFATPSPMLTAAGIATGEGGSAVLLTFGFYVVACSLAALVFHQLAERQFDRLVGRPWRLPVGPAKRPTIPPPDLPPAPPETAASIAQPVSP